MEQPLLSIFCFHSVLGFKIMDFILKLLLVVLFTIRKLAYKETSFT